MSFFKNLITKRPDTAISISHTVVRRLYGFSPLAELSLWRLRAVVIGFAPRSAVTHQHTAHSAQCARGLGLCARAGAAAAGAGCGRAGTSRAVRGLVGGRVIAYVSPLSSISLVSRYIKYSQRKVMVLCGASYLWFLSPVIQRTERAAGPGWQRESLDRQIQVKVAPRRRSNARRCSSSCCCCCGGDDDGARGWVPKGAACRLAKWSCQASVRPSSRAPSRISSR